MRMKPENSTKNWENCWGTPSNLEKSNNHYPHRWRNKTKISVRKNRLNLILILRDFPSEILTPVSNIVGSNPRNLRTRFDLLKSYVSVYCDDRNCENCENVFFLHFQFQWGIALQWTKNWNTQIDTRSLMIFIFFLQITSNTDKRDVTPRSPFWMWISH